MTVKAPAAVSRLRSWVTSRLPAASRMPAVIKRPAGAASAGWSWLHERVRSRTGAGRSGARFVSALVVSVLFVGLLFVAVFPTRSYLSQRASLRTSQHKLHEIDRRSSQLEREARQLSTPAEIERLARAQYGLVRPGEEAYAILPAPVTPIGLPEVWPFAGVEHLLGTR